MERSVGGVGVLDKAVVILEVLERAPASLTELVAATDLPRATVYRLAVALEAHGLVRRDLEGRFRLGYRLVLLGRAAGQSHGLRDLAVPILSRLRDETGESVQLYVRDGRLRVCLLSLESTNELRTIVEEGARLPLDKGSAGRVLDDSWSGEQEWVESVGERQSGVASVSAPVVDQAGIVLAAVSISGPIERLSRRPGSRHGDDVVRAAKRVARLLT